MYSVEIQISELCEVFLDKQQDLLLLTQYIIKKFKIVESAENEISLQLSKKNLGKFKDRWSKVSGMKNKFFEKNSIAGALIQ
jgi:hypothetical protein